jgi:hypothetical protein
MVFWLSPRAATKVRRPFTSTPPKWSYTFGIDIVCTSLNRPV